MDVARSSTMMPRRAPPLPTPRASPRASDGCSNGCRSDSGADAGATARCSVLSGGDRDANVRIAGPAELQQQLARHRKLEFDDLVRSVAARRALVPGRAHEPAIGHHIDPEWPVECDAVRTRCPDVE